MTALRRLALAFVATPLVLGLAACGEEAATDGAPRGEAIAAIPAPAGQSWLDAVTVTPEGGWLLGNPEAPIKLVEYGSLTCPACANFAETGITPLREQYVSSGRVSFEFRSVPLHGAIDLVLTRLLECAPKEAAHPLSEQVWSNLNAVLGPIEANQAGLQQAMSLPENQRFIAYAEQGGLFDFFAARGISVDQARQCLADFPAMQALAEKLDAQARADGVNSTPTFFLNGVKLQTAGWGPRSSDPGLEVALQNAGAR